MVSSYKSENITSMGMLQFISLVTKRKVTICHFFPNSNENTHSNTHSMMAEVALKITIRFQIDHQQILNIIVIFSAASGVYIWECECVAFINSNYFESTVAIENEYRLLSLLELGYKLYSKSNIPIKWFPFINFIIVFSSLIKLVCKKQLAVAYRNREHEEGGNKYRNKDELQMTFYHSLMGGIKPYLKTYSNESIGLELGRLSHRHAQICGTKDKINYHQLKTSKQINYKNIYGVNMYQKVRTLQSIIRVMNIDQPQVSASPCAGTTMGPFLIVI